MEESPSTSLSLEASDRDDGGEVGQGPLDHLPDIVEVVPGRWPAAQHSREEEEKRTRGRRLFFLSRKRPADELPLAPLKALKASPGSSAHWVVEAQATIQHGATSTRVDPRGLAAQGGATKAAPTQTREGALLPRGGEAHESDGAGVPLVAEAAEVFEVEAMEATAPTTTETAVAAVGVSASAEATMAEAEAPETVEAIIVEAGAPEMTKAVVMAAMPSVREAETQAAEASVVPLV
ncbi:uncharacterized protein [Miscanthus floridulus]|uniref:uncharacterized protein n=1 Tax=Miscanthus floridulus TaxID=154761 RepID=UPI003459FEC4